MIRTLGPTKLAMSKQVFLESLGLVSQRPQHLRGRGSTKICHSLPSGWGFPGGSGGELSACNVGNLGSIPGLGRSPGEGNGNPFQYSCLENPVNGGAWWATVHGVAKSRIQLSNFTGSLVHLQGTSCLAAK